MQHFGAEGSLDTTKAIPPANRGTAGNQGGREFAIVMAESKKTYV